MLLSQVQSSQVTPAIQQPIPPTVPETNKWLYFAAPAATFFVCAGVAAALFWWKRKDIKRLLEFSRTIRYLFSVFSVVLIPLVVCAWADLIDVSNILQGNITGSDSRHLSLIAVLLVGYLLCHCLTLYHEEVLETDRRNALLDFKDVECQRGFLVNFLECLRKAIGRHVQLLAEFKANDAETFPHFSERKTKEVIHFLLEVVRSTYRTLPTVPADAKVALVLFHEVGEFLEPYASFNGMQFDYFNGDYQRCRQQFHLKHHMSSAAVDVALSQVVEVVENAELAHNNSKHPFSFFANHPRQREEIGSLICLPFTTDSPEKRWVLCVTCSKSGGFLEEHEWKSRYLRDEIGIRVNFILEAGRILETISTASEAREKEMFQLKRKLDTIEGRPSAELAGIRQAAHQTAHPGTVDKPLFEKMFGSEVDTDNIENRKIV